jgi:sigma-B regulation protein RsbU (phosphoserine phosphatase)
MADTARKSWIPGVGFLRAMLRALNDEATYDLRRNPSLGVGFLLAIPIPLLTFAADAAAWLKLLTLPAPFLWALVVGATGRVGMIAKQERDILAGEIRRVVSKARETEAHLGKEQVRRRELEEEQREVVSELKLAQAVQATLWSPPIRRADLDVVSHNIPTRFIGGDYTHAIVVENRWVYLCLLDVSGHGISAALVVARIHGLVRRLTLTKKGPLEMTARLNEFARHLLQHTYFFMTGVIARLDLDTGELEYVTAGHHAQILLRADGEIEELHTANRLLGMDDDIFDAEAPSKIVQLEPGDSVVLFTDGLFELLEAGKGEMLGEAGLHERIHGLGAMSPQLLIGEVLQELADFQGSSEFDDDVTLVVARYRGRSEEVLAPAPRS